MAALLALPVGLLLGLVVQRGDFGMRSALRVVAGRARASLPANAIVAGEAAVTL